MRSLVAIAVLLVVIWIAYASGEYTICLYQKKYDPFIAETDIREGCLRRVFLRVP